MQTYSIVQVIARETEVVASGLSWVEAMNQSMALAAHVGGTFREVADGTDWFAVQAARNAAPPCRVQAAWAYL